MINEYAPTAQDLLHRLAECPGLVGVRARYSDVDDYLHVLHPEGGVWHLLPAVDLPAWVRRLAPRRRGRSRRGGDHTGAG